MEKTSFDKMSSKVKTPRSNDKLIKIITNNPYSTRYYFPFFNPL